MKKVFALSAALLTMVTTPVLVRAEDAPQISGEIEAGAIVGSGLQQSAKVNEHEDRSSGPTGAFTVNYRDKGTGDYATLSSTDLGRQDRESELSMGRDGQYKFEFSYRQIPHAYAYGARTLYSGAGSDSLTLPEGLQAQLQSSASLADAANRLKAQSESEGHSYGAGVLRKIGKAKLEYRALRPLSFMMEVSREDREGVQPVMGSFGFNNLTEIINPIDYTTTQARFGVDYATKDVYLSGSYYFSSFKNEFGALTWANPFRVSDSTSPSAYTNPANAVGGGLMNMGAANGRMALAPDNLYHGPTFTASIGDLPAHSRLTFTSALAWMSQDDELLPYTSNSAVTGTGAGGSFQASDSGALPTDSADLSVFTQTYRVALTSRPIDWLDLGAKYRYYEYQNDSGEILFPGYVRTDATWVTTPLSTTPLNYRTQNVSADGGVRVGKKTRLGLAYLYKGTQRDNSEVNDDQENTVEASLSSALDDWINVKASFDKSFKRVGAYDYTAGDPEADSSALLPLMRKYYESSKDTDRVYFLTNLTPTEDLDLTGSATYGQSDYTESEYGLLSDRFFTLTGDVSYQATSWWNVSAFYSYEQHTSRENARQWTPGGIGDPRLDGVQPLSYSDWGAENIDVIHTVGAGSKFTILPKTLFLDLNYELSNAGGKVKYSSPLGIAGFNDSNAFDPSDVDESDHTILQRLDAALRYRVTKAWTFSVGYLWESFDVGDFSASGYSDVPTKGNGDYNSALLSGTWPYQNYTVNMGYTTLKYRF